MEYKAHTSILDLRPSMYQVQLFWIQYASCNIPPMLSTAKWPVEDGYVAPLLARETIDAHTFYDVFRAWKEERKMIFRTFPIPVVVVSTETTD